MQAIGYQWLAGVWRLAKRLHTDILMIGIQACCSLGRVPAGLNGEMENLETCGFAVVAGIAL